MKKLTNKQRCKNCLHRCVCLYQTYYEGLDDLERCKHYYSKEQAYKPKKQAQKQSNNVIELPCKVGDTVYIVSRYYTGEFAIHECKVVELSIYENNTFITAESKEKNKKHFGLNIKTINNLFFLTKEKAEKALAEREGKE